MKQIPTSLLVSLLLWTACAKEASTAKAPDTKPPAGQSAAPPSKGAAPAEKPPTEKAPAEKTPTEKAPAEKTPAEKAPAKSVDMDAAIATLMARPEHTDPAITVQHVLIAFQGSGVPTATRSKDEAKALAQKVYAEAIGGGNFDELVKKYTNDSAPGIYPMTTASRRGMVAGFGDVGWRLKVGEIGVAPFDAKASPYGWHIIKRIK